MKAGAVTAAVIALVGSSMTAAWARGSTAAQPHIVVQPSTAPAGSTVAVHGTHFAARTKLTVQECSASSWIAPQDPCLSHNAVTIRTNRWGGFRIQMVVRRCLVRTQSGAYKRTGTCYIGVPHPSGVDTIELTGAAPIQVTR